MLLVMGLATQMLGWHEDFCGELGRARLPRDPLRQPRHRPLVEARGRAGAEPGCRCCSASATPAYTLTDLAGDAAGLLDALEHRLRPRRRRVDGRDDRADARDRAPGAGALPRLDHVRPGHARHAAAAAARLRDADAQAQPKEREAAVEHTVKVFEVIGSPGFETDEEHLREVSGLSFDRSRYPQGVARQLHAVTASPARARGRCARCASRPWSSTATRTRSFAPRPAGRRRGRSRTRASSASRAWATTCRAGRGRGSSARSPRTPPAARSGAQPAPVGA